MFCSSYSVNVPLNYTIPDVSLILIHDDVKVVMDIVLKTHLN